MPETDLDTNPVRCGSRRSRWPRSLRMALSLVGLISIAAPSHALADDAFHYQRRGEGATLRHEGTVREPVTGSFTLLSFTGSGPTAAAAADPHLTVWFRSGEPVEAHLLVREIEDRHSYRMQAERTTWGSGWSQFAWPPDVVGGLEIPPGNLGATVTASAVPSDSGTVYPAVVGARPDRITRYQLIFKSSTSMAPLSWNVYRLEHDGRMVRIESASGSAARVPAATPAFVDIDASGLPEGEYKIVVAAEWSGIGGRTKSRRSYEFRHFGAPLR